MSIVLVLQALKVRAWSVQNELLVSSPLAGEQIMRIEAAVARANSLPLSFEKLELEEPRHDEVRVRLIATGVCHTDMAIRDHTSCRCLNQLFSASAATAPVAKSACRPATNSSHAILEWPSKSSQSFCFSAADLSPPCSNLII